MPEKPRLVLCPARLLLCRWAENDVRLREMTEATCRHFEAVAEHMQANVRIISEGHAHLISIVGNHESRLKTLEKRS